MWGCRCRPGVGLFAFSIETDLDLPFFVLSRLSLFIKNQRSSPPAAWQWRVAWVVSPIHGAVAIFRFEVSLVFGLCGSSLAVSGLTTRPLYLPFLSSEYSSFLPSFLPGLRSSIARPD